MKIAFIGTHGIGKTTLTYGLVAELKKKGLHALPLGEVVRDCPFPVNETTTKKAQVWIITSQIARELELGQKAEYVVCDRSVLDNYVYLFNKFGHDKVYYNLAKEWLKTYDFLFKVDMNKKYVQNDGFRSTDTEFQKNIDAKFGQLLEEMGQAYYPCSSVQEAMDIILKTKAQ